MPNPKPPTGPSKINMIAPVALVLIAYTYLFHSPQQAILQKEKSRLANLVTSASEAEGGLMATLQAQATLKPELRKLRQSLETEQRVQRQVIADHAALRQSLLRPSRPVATMGRVTELLRRHRLTVVESASQRDSVAQVKAAVEPLLKLLVTEDSPAVTSAAVTSAVTRAADKAASRDLISREIYEIRLNGRFDDLRLALQAMVTEFENVIALSVEMEPLRIESSAGKTNQRVWVLQLMV